MLDWIERRAPRSRIQCVLPVLLSGSCQHERSGLHSEWDEAKMSSLLMVRIMLFACYARPTWTIAAFIKAIVIIRNHLKPETPRVKNQRNQMRVSKQGPKGRAIKAQSIFVQGKERNRGIESAVSECLVGLAIA